MPLNLDSDLIIFPPFPIAQAVTDILCQFSPPTTNAGLIPRHASYFPLLCIYVYIISRITANYDIRSIIVSYFREFSAIFNFSGLYGAFLCDL